MNRDRLHWWAMRACDAADAARRDGLHQLATRILGVAMRWERQAALAEPTQPSRAILLRSAAWLALQAGQPHEAARLAALGIEDAQAPERLRRELREVAAAAAQALLVPQADTHTEPAEVPDGQ